MPVVFILLVLISFFLNLNKQYLITDIKTAEKNNFIYDLVLKRQWKTLLTSVRLWLCAMCLMSFLYAFSGCPQPSKVLICTPTCITDKDCRNGWLCCDNICHTKSCTNLRNDGSDGYKSTVCEYLHLMTNIVNVISRSNIHNM